MGKSEQELDAEARRLRKLAEQDVKDLNAGREREPLGIGRDLLKLALLIGITLLVIWLFTGCLVIKTRNAQVTAVGSVKKAQVTPAGEVFIEDASSPLERGLDGLSNTGMFAWIRSFVR